jgi:hypothetical protein
MKKLTLLLLSGALAVGAQAQQLRQHSLVSLTNEGKAVEQLRAPNSKIAVASPARANRQSLSKGAGLAFYTETFATGATNPNRLATGWTASTPTAGFSGTWHWTNQAATGNFNIGTLASTTASNGWMIFDSDSIGSTNPTVPFFEGYLTSPVINCSSHPQVEVSFEESFSKFADTCYLEVSNNGTTWTKFPITVNNKLANNGDLQNPTLVRMIISSVAGGQANVQIRFHYICNYANGGGTFNWLVDDVKLSDADATDLAVGKSGMVMALSATQSPLADFNAFNSMPLHLVDSLLPLTTITNYGYNPQSNINVNVQIFNGTSSVYNQNLTYPTVGVGGVDSFVEFTGPRYKPTAIGNYIAVFKTTAAGDANTANDVDTVRFNITDTVYAPYGYKGSLSAYYLHRPPSGSVSEESYSQGVRFDMAPGKSDTVTSVSASLFSGTPVGTQIQAQLYRVNGSGTNLSWLLVAKSNPRALTAADINLSGSTSTFANFKMTATNSSRLVLPANSTDNQNFAAIISTVGAPSSAVVAIWSSNVPPYAYPGVIGYQGVSDTSNNSGTGSPLFGSDGTVANGQSYVPMVRVNFNHPAKLVLGVGNIPGVTVGEAYPNPARTSINVPVTVEDQANVTVSLTNILGQVVRTENIGTVAGGSTKLATINTSDLANGVYLCTIEAKGQRTATRIVVAH